MSSHEVELITRVEGHAVYAVDLEKGEVKSVRFAPVEGARLFEAWLRQRHYDEVYFFASRICGFCPVSHNLASVKAVEAALQVQPSEQTVKLRKIMNFGEHLQSHCIHVFFLSLPDFVGAESAFALLPQYGEEVKAAVEFRDHANYLIEAVGGRPVHPMATAVGGFRRLPTPTQIAEMLSRARQMKKLLEKLVDFYSKAKVPEFSRETEYLGLQSQLEYALYDGCLASTKGFKAEVEAYKQHIEEEVREYSTAKYYTREGKPFMVGALARFNLNYDQLSDDAKETAETLGLKHPTYNSFHNTTAQLVEMVHDVDEVLKILEEFQDSGLKDERPPKVEVKPGKGTASVEAPRGTLIHSYEMDGNGLLREVDIVTPTAMSLNNVEADMRVLVKENLNLPREKLASLVEALIRAYDPCISCSVHFLRK
ncbi:MAG: Ni/Fe hydrogenase subunit alpha [Candidatus Hecatellales archaeon]|nr:MAG: Ni/Fe hydrogenase subunit alpha [Candidatus Hecatellales archaeon]